MSVKMPETALELLTPRPRERPLLDQIWGPLFGSWTGCGMMVFGNFGSNRPLLSGIHKIVTATVVGGFIGDYLYKMRAEYLAESDAQLRHYVELHPEDFPLPERKKYSEVLEEWVPIR